MRKRIFCIGLCAFMGAFACSKLPGYWNTYTHPTYRFSFDVPAKWEKIEGGIVGPQVAFVDSDDAGLFRTNVNIVVERRPEKKSLDQLGDQSLTQLRTLLKEYELLSKVRTKLGNLAAIELRGRYQGAEGTRILRTFLAFTNDLQYVLTFACREEREAATQPSVSRIVDSFHAPASLRQ